MRRSLTADEMCDQPRQRGRKSEYHGLEAAKGAHGGASWVKAYSLRARVAGF
jgi:hypothetical protein